jgi:pyruvate dehydrogenase E1 component alpha subunit
METYRTRDQVADLRRRFDPISRLRQEFESAELFDAASIEAVDAEIEREILDAVAFAEASPFPDPASLLDHVPLARVLGEATNA